MGGKALALVTAVGLGACAATPGTPEPPSRQLVMPEKAALYKLDNGMRVLVVADPTMDTVAIDVRHEVGAAADPPGKEGLAHLVEHLMFELKPWGQQKPTVGAVLAAAALETNAKTTWDYTHYDILGAEESTTLLAEVAAARLRFDCEHLSQEVFEREREVVRSELRTRYGNAGSQLRQRLRQSIYGAGHPYQRLPGGVETGLDAITLDDACGFISQHYRPESTIVVMAGGVTQESANDLLARMGDIPARPGPAPAPAVARDWTPAPAPVTVEADTRSSWAMLLFPLPPRHHPDELAARRLLSTLVERAQRDSAEDIAEVGMTSMGGELAPVGALWARVEDAADLQRAHVFLREQLAAFREAGFTPFSAEEIAYMRKHPVRNRGSSVFARGSAENSSLADILADNYYAAQANYHGTSLLFDLDPLSNRADVYADYVQFDSSNQFVTGELQRNHALTVEDLRAAGERLLRTEPMVVHIRANPAIEESYVLRGELGSIDGAEDDLRSRLPVDPRVAGRTLELPSRHSRLDDARTLRLENGMNVILLPSSSLPLVELRLLFRSGNGQDPQDLGGLADVAADLVGSGGLQERIGSVSSFVLGQVGGWRHHHVGYHTTTFTMRGQTRHVDMLIQGLENRIRGQYSDEAMAAYRTRMDALLAEPSTRRPIDRSRALRAAVYGAAHPYAREVGLTHGSLERIDAAAATRFQQAHYRAGNATLIVTGQFDPALVEEHVRFSFGDWEAGAAPDAANVGPHARPPGALHLGIAQEDRLQTGVALFYPTAPGIDDDHAARLVLERMLSLRMQAVREVLGASYGIDVSYAPALGPGLLAIAGDVSSPRAGEALAAMRDAIDGLRRGEGFDRDFVIARRRVARDLLVENADARSLAARLAFIALHGLPQGFHERLTRQVASLRPADVKRVLARELAPAQETTLCVGEREDVEHTYEQAGIMHFEVVE